MKNITSHLKEHLEGVKGHIEEVRGQLEEKVNAVSQKIQNSISKKACSGVETGFEPAMDMYETEKGFVIEIELSGVEKEDIALTLGKESITIRGEKKAQNTIQEIYFEERDYGKFFKVIPMPLLGDEKSVGAEYKNGLLTVTINKKEVVVEPVIEIEIK
ncbi:MAG: Hsp20/alpha crystallin family protein [Fusobacteria bacterium]|nr:Hsp20/alpha crystallin family protein [Fusobacteriota bacterium]